MLLSLKLIADVGLLGLPNAGKVDLVGDADQGPPEDRRLSVHHARTDARHRPRSRAGFVRDGGHPGLIEGASGGRGLGDKFLKHIERTRLLLHLIDCGDLPMAEPAEAWRLLRNEVAAYSAALAERPTIIVATKVEDAAARARAQVLADTIGQPVLPISSATGHGLSDLVAAVWTPAPRPSIGPPASGRTSVSGRHLAPNLGEAGQVGPSRIALPSPIPRGRRCALAPPAAGLWPQRWGADREARILDLTTQPTASAPDRQPAAQVARLPAHHGQGDASDLVLKANGCPAVRVAGVIRFLGDQPLPAELLRTYVDEVLSERQRADFSQSGATDTAVALPGVGRFRCNAFHQCGEFGSSSAPSRARRRRSRTSTCRSNR